MFLLHWGIEPNKKLFVEIDERTETGNEELMTVSHITGVTRRSEKEVTMFEPLSYEGYKICDSGDLVINTMWAWMGALGIAKERGMVSPSYNVYRLKDNTLVGRFYDYFSRTDAHICDIIRHSKGIWKSRLRVYPYEFMDIVTPVPPNEEQQDIIDFLESEEQRIDLLIQKIHQATKHLKEYRTALISAAVTGKVDVRDYGE